MRTFERVVVVVAVASIVVGFFNLSRGSVSLGLLGIFCGGTALGSCLASQRVRSHG